MLWRIALELVFVVALAFAGGPFWSCLKSPNHLRKLLGDSAELKRIIEHIGYDTLAADAQNIEPVLGTYGRNIEIWDIAHRKSLSQTRNYLGFACVGILAASWWLGIWYFVVSVVVFVLLGAAELPAVAKNNNAKHVPTAILNIMKWSQVEEQACGVFCQQLHPEYCTLYLLLCSLRPARQPSSAIPSLQAESNLEP